MVNLMQDATKRIFLADYDWSIENGDLVLDSQLNTDQFGWTNGDYFQFKNVNGKKHLVKVDPLELFLDGATLNRRV